MNTFSGLSVRTELCAALESKKITEPTPVQEQVIPRIIAGENILFQSETGTGKTFCYLLPAFMKALEMEGNVTPKILVLAPTHELASQIKGEAVSLAKDSGLPVTAALCIGGAPLKRQIEMLKAKPTILVGGPARIIELIRLKKLKVHGIGMVVLDESDRMLAPEMRDLISEILSLMPASAQYIACSATLSTHHASLLENMIPQVEAHQQAEEPAEGGEEIAKTSKKAKKPYKLTLLTLPPEDVLKRKISHWAFYAEGRDKIDTLRRFLLAAKQEKVLVFTAVAGQVDMIVSKLQWSKIECAGLHAKMDKISRKKSIDDFRSGRSKVLVTSDLSARGLDIPDVTCVVQLDVNENKDFFIHRAGRTARAGKSGINAIFGDEKELRSLSRIEKSLGIVIYPKVIYSGRILAADEDGEQTRE